MHIFKVERKTLMHVLCHLTTSPRILRYYKRWADSQLTFLHICNHKKYVISEEENLQGKVFVQLGRLYRLDICLWIIVCLKLDFCFLNLLVFAVRLKLLNCATIDHIQNESIKLVNWCGSVKLLNVKAKAAQCSDIPLNFFIADSSWYRQDLWETRRKEES